MGLVQYLVIALVLSAQLVLTSPVADRTGDDNCKWCPPGEYQKSCTECAPCPPGGFTSQKNREESCLRCFGDCTPNLHLRVVQNCTRIANLKCACETGYTCKERNSNGICRLCVKNQETTTSVFTTVISRKDEQTPVSTSSGHGITSGKPCPFPKCGLQTLSPTSNDTDTARSQLATILSPVFVMGIVALVILFCVRRPGDETCFKQAIVKLYNEGGRDASHKSRESTQQFPRDSFSAKQQPPSPSAANLGPVHVHNPGTVIFSLLSQFTGQVGPTLEGKGTPEKVSSEGGDRDCPVFHPTSSPSVHLSEEERSDSIFFPSQEQGKDCHISKEEEL